MLRRNERIKAKETELTRVAPGQVDSGSWFDWLAYVLLRCVVCAVQLTSLENCDRLCRLAAKVLADWTWLRREVTDSNLELVYGQLSSEHKSLLRQKMWHHLLLMVCEIAHAPRKIHRTNWQEHFYMPKRQAMLKLIMDDRATVMVTGHYGNFEVAGYAVSVFGTPTTTIARPMDNPYIDRFIGDFRSLGGQRMLPKKDSAIAVQDHLAAKGTLALLADQHAGGKGTWIDFFGHPTSCHKGLALFVLSAKAPMVVNYTRRLDRPLRFEMGVTGVADPKLMESEEPPKYLESVQALTEWYNVRLEQAIRVSPEQYWWLHRRWRAVPPAVQRKLDARRAAS